MGIAQESVVNDSAYQVFFEGKFKNKKIKIMADDSIVFNSCITSKNPNVIILAKEVTIHPIPKKIVIYLGWKKLSFTVNPEKKFLYVTRRNQIKYEIKESEFKKKYR